MATKQVIVARTDLNLSPGKLAAQVAHAAVNATKRAREDSPEWYDDWMTGQYTKVVLAGDNEAHLRALAEAADENALPRSLVSDAGRTEIESGTVTALAIGPAPEGDIDRVTGNLSLYPSN
jgi:PTH2 family peptidyl-tRNA hydrolase